MAGAIRERGYRDTSIADVVRHAGTSKRTFYQHFEGKQECFVALQEEPALTVCWIRDTPALGAEARRVEREVMERYVALIRSLADNPVLKAAGLESPGRPVVIMLLGGLRELIATTIEDGGDLNDLYDLMAEKTMALLATP
ncbi:MAG: TetR family transcriptional regulator [Streptosporangiales bacterium]|nr:TetR family transcriptional regulator [Streptosporangiales bacterium]